MKRTSTFLAIGTLALAASTTVQAGIRPPSEDRTPIRIAGKKMSASQDEIAAKVEECVSSWLSQLRGIQQAQLNQYVSEIEIKTMPKGLGRLFHHWGGSPKAQRSSGFGRRKFFIEIREGDRTDRRQINEDAIRDPGFCSNNEMMRFAHGQLRSFATGSRALVDKAEDKAAVDAMPRPGAGGGGGDLIGDGRDNPRVVDARPRARTKIEPPGTTLGTTENSGGAPAGGATAGGIGDDAGAEKPAAETTDTGTTPADPGAVQQTPSTAATTVDPEKAALDKKIDELTAELKGMGLELGMNRDLIGTNTISGGLDKLNEADQKKAKATLAQLNQLMRERYQLPAKRERATEVAQAKAEFEAQKGREIAAVLEELHQKTNIKVTQENGNWKVNGADVPSNAGPEALRLLGKLNEIQARTYSDAKAGADKPQAPTTDAPTVANPHAPADSGWTVAKVNQYRVNQEKELTNLRSIQDTTQKMRDDAAQAVKAGVESRLKAIAEAKRKADEAAAEYQKTAPGKRNLIFDNEVKKLESDHEIQSVVEQKIADALSSNFKHASNLHENAVANYTLHEQGAQMQLGTLNDTQKAYEELLKFLKSLPPSGGSPAAPASRTPAFSPTITL